MTALGAEVIWTRLLSLMLGATGHTFSIILAVFLEDSVWGSMAGSVLGRNTSRPDIALGWCQMFLAGGNGMGGVYVKLFAAVLAGQSRHCAQPLVHFPA